MRVHYKYTLKVLGLQVLDLPASPKLVHLADQGGKLTLWV